MKKNYQKPTVFVSNVQLTAIICVSTFTNLQPTVVHYGGSSENDTSGQIRSRAANSWDDDEEPDKKYDDYDE
jgi:hypothetical protein